MIIKPYDLSESALLALKALWSLSAQGALPNISVYLRQVVEEAEEIVPVVEPDEESFVCDIDNSLFTLCDKGWIEIQAAPGLGMLYSFREERLSKLEELLEPVPEQADLDRLRVSLLASRSD